MSFFDRLFSRKAKPSISLPKYEKKQSLLTPSETTNELLDDNQFWQLIATSKSLSNGDYEDQQQQLGSLLQELPAIDIIFFDNRFRAYQNQAYTWELWGAAYIIHGGCSDDCFSDFRGWLIGQGKETFFAALKDTGSLVALDRKVNKENWEGLSYVAMTAYERKTGISMAFGAVGVFTEPAGDDWDEDDLVERFPGIWKRWGE